MLAYVGNGVGWFYYHLCIDYIALTCLDTSFTELLFSLISVVLLFSSSSTTYNTSITHFIELHFIVLLSYCSFYKLKICGKPELSKSVGTTFLKTFDHFRCGNSHNISNFFMIIIFYCDLWHYYCKKIDLLRAQMIISNV